MQNLFWAVVPLLFRRVLLLIVLLCAFTKAVAASKPKVHTVVMGSVRRVPYVAADVAAEDKADSATTLRIRPLIVDERVREWVTGNMHEVTERTFVVRRISHINDALATDKVSRWVWQPGPWLLVDRSTGHVSVLHLPDFDDMVSDVVWYRDYAAYCGVHSTTKMSTLVGAVWQIGTRRLALQKPLGKWPQPDHPRPVCMPAVWQREPMRVVLQMNGGMASIFEVAGTSAILSDSEGEEESQ